MTPMQWLLIIIGWAISFRWGWLARGWYDKPSESI